MKRPLIFAVVCLLLFIGLTLNTYADTDLPKEKQQNEFWDIQSDTWVAVDGLGRRMPDASKTGPPKIDKTIGMFYFIWHGSHGDRGPFDISKILEQDPDAVHHPTSPPWATGKPMYHWGEPLFNYYVAGDDFVIRKHAQMLSDAGVDVIIFDVTNNHTYPEVYRAICRVFSEMRKQGNKTPQIAFMTSFSRADKTETTLWKDLYSKGDYSDLWFRWKGKPLMMANPEFIMSEKQEYVFPDSKLVHEQVKKDAPLGQTFTVNRPLQKAAIRVPTWGAKPDSAVDLTLYSLQSNQEKLPGKKVLSKRFTKIADNDWLALKAETPLPAGKYYLEQVLVSGTAGWWSIAESNQIPGGQLYVARNPKEGTRMIRVTRVPEDPIVDPLLEFFTFRSPFGGQGAFFNAPTKPDQWAWLQIYPQHGFYSSDNMPDKDGKVKKVEEVAVSIAQHVNIEGTKTTVFSNPNTRGRSFHQGKMPPPEQRDFTGKNFAEQWRRAIELDPEFVFITGWNEWIAGRFPRETRWNGSDTQEVNFVDQFDREHSRDIEPMQGGHGDAFYYEMIAYNRKFKGVREVEPVQSQPIIVDGKFDDWKNVSPEFRDTIGDPVKRNYRGWAKDTKYVNQTGRNDIIAAKVSYDKKSETLFFYARTNAPIVGEKEKNWMMLYLDIDADSKTGWLGYDYLVEEKTLKKNLKDEYSWQTTEPVKGIVKGNEYEIAIPLKALGLTSVPKSILFKWADNIQQTGDWSDFTLNGDAAPNDRYNYKAVF
ncbi:hypothetical protein FACS1894214_2420 [Planctomycetales bacterium]|nr:hypothetical protein FACS1894214_2420 [Planctomycetales bacterium]